MQTFIMYPDFRMCAEVLDSKRLKNQIREADILISAHENDTGSKWRNHPAFKMWTSYLPALKLYRDYMFLEYTENRNGNYDSDVYGYTDDQVTLPPFIRDRRFLISHQSNLVRKEPDIYPEYGWKYLRIDGYFWPCQVKQPRTLQINFKWTFLVLSLDKPLAVSDDENWNYLLD